MLPQTASTAPALGRYRIVGELGRGAMGVVYRAVDPLLDRTVAIKTVNLAEALDEATEYDARFQQEAKAAGRLAHANLITIHDVGREGDIAFMAMEFLEGQELRSLIAQRGRLPVAEAIRHRGPGRRRPRIRPRARRHPPGHQAGQHHDPPERAGEDHGLRHRTHALVGR